MPALVALFDAVVVVTASSPLLLLLLLVIPGQVSERWSLRERMAGRERERAWKQAACWCCCCQADEPLRREIRR